MEIKVSEQAGKTVASIKGMLDTTCSEQFKEEMEKLLAKDNLDLTMDMTELEYISSHGIRTVLSVIKQMDRKGLNLEFRGIRPAVMEIFKLSGLTEVMKIA